MQTALAHLFLRCWGWIPAFMLPWLANAIGFSLRLVRFRRRDIERHLGWAFPQLSAPERQRLVQEIYHHFGLLVVECLRLPTMSSQELADRCRVHNFHLVKDLIDAKKGFFVLAAHVGNWELGLAGMAAQGYSAQAVVKEIKGKFGQAIVEKMRRTHGVGMIFRGENAGRKILLALKHGEAVGFVLDQNMTDDEGIFVDFFGRTACTMSGLAVLTSRSRVPVIPVRFERDADGYHHHVWILPPVPWEEMPTREAALQHNTGRYTKVIEEMIRCCPAQWMWMHRRWKTQPDPDKQAPAAKEPGA